MKRFLVTALSALFVFTLAGCGGGGGGTSNGGASDGGTSNGEVINPVIKSVTYKLSIEGPISSTDIKGLEFELVLPVGATLKYAPNTDDPDTGVPLPGIVEPSPSMPQIISIFSSSTRVLRAGFFTTGIGPGEFATVTCEVPPDSPAPGVQNVKATGVLGNSTVTLEEVKVLITN